MLVVAIICGILIYGGFIFLIVWLVRKHKREKRARYAKEGLSYTVGKDLRDGKCIFTGEPLVKTVTRDTGYDTPVQEVQYARVWAGKLEVETRTLGGHVNGDQDCILTSPKLGYQINRTEHSWVKKTLFCGEDVVKQIKFEIISYGKLNDTQKKTLTQAVEAADYTL